MRIVYRSTFEDYLNSQRAHAWRRYSPGLARLQKVVQPLVGILLLWFSYYYSTKRGSSAVVLFETVIGLYLLLAPSVLTPFLYRRAFRRTRGMETDNIIEITEDSIQIDCPGRSAGTLQWAAVKGFLDTPKTTLLYVSAALFMPIPRRLLDFSQHQELLPLLTAKSIPASAPKPIKTVKI